jgi:hypothetical protein
MNKNIVIEDAASTSLYTQKLRIPLEYEGKTYKELTFDFDNINGAAVLTIESEMRASGIILVSPAFSPGFQIRFAARACKANVGYDGLTELSAKDFLDVTGAVRNFLI